MFRVWSIAVGPALFAVAGLVVVASHAGAQPPDRGFEKKEGVRKDGPRKEADRKDGNPVEMLERQLAELRARTVEVEAQLKKVREGTGGERPNPMPPRGPMGPGGFGGTGGFGPGNPGSPFGGGGRPGDAALEAMSAEQIKATIARLQMILDKKATETARKPGGGPDRPGASQEEILKRLDRLTQEIDEIRRSIKK